MTVEYNVNPANLILASGQANSVDGPFLGLPNNIDEIVVFNDHFDHIQKEHSTWSANLKGHFRFGLTATKGIFTQQILNPGIQNADPASFTSSENPFGVPVFVWEANLPSATLPFGTAGNSSVMSGMRDTNRVRYVIQSMGEGYWELVTAFPVNMR